MRRLLRTRAVHVAVCLGVATAGLGFAGQAPADPRPDTIRLVAGGAGREVFTVENPAEGGAARQVVGIRRDPACPASTVVLLQHGLSYHKESWEWPGASLMGRLAAAGYATVAIDRLGYGESGLEDGTRVSFEAYADMADQIVGQLRQRYDHVVMAGHSAGAGVTEYAQGVFGSADAIAALGWHHRPSDQVLSDFMTGDVPRSLEDDYEYFLGTPEHRAWMFYSANADPAVVEADNRAANLTPSGEIQTIGKQPSRYAVGKVDVPVFIQLAENDRLFAARYGDLHASEFLSSPSVTVDVVPGAGHTFMLAPEGPAAADRMTGWLRSLPETPACGGS